MTKKSLRKRGILVVDDNSNQLKALDGLLGLKGYRCFKAATGEVAVRLIKQHQNSIHACLLDLRLENSTLTGIETLRNVNKIDPSLPILAFTAHDQGEISNAVAAGATLFIRKQDFDATSLIVSLDALVQMRALTQDVQHRQKATTLMSSLMEYVDQTPEKITDFVADFLHKQLEFTRVRIYLLNNEETPVGMAARGMWDEFDITQYHIEDDDENALGCFKEDRPVLITGEELKKDRRYKEFRKEGVRNQLQIPLRSASGKVGLITLDDKDSERQISHEDMDLMSLVSVAIASAINVCKRKKKEARRNEWYRTLADFDDTLARATSVTEVLKLMIDTLKVFLRTDSGVILTEIPNSQGLQIAAASDNVARDVFSGIHPGTFGIIGQCYEDGKLIYEPDTQSSKVFQDCINKLEKNSPLFKYFHKTKSALAQPIRCGDRHTIGVLYLQFLSKAEVPKLDQSFLTSVARRIAIALAKLDKTQRIEAAMIQQAKLTDLAALTAGVAHGIRNPLTTIQSSAELALKNLSHAGENNEETIQFAATLEQTIQQTQGALETLDRLVDWATPKGTEATLISVKELLKDLMALVREEFCDDRKIAILEQFTDGSCFVKASPDSLRMALADLFWNARRHMPDGGTLTVRLSLLPSKDICIEIADTGTGMSEAKVKSLFRFNPLEPIAPGGIGLGLYLCRKIVDSIGGEIWCESTLGKGTSIFITIPSASSLLKGNQHE